jgi:hypothetical protein
LKSEHEFQEVMSAFSEKKLLDSKRRDGFFHVLQA